MGGDTSQVDTRQTHNELRTRLDRHVDPVQDLVELLL